MNAGLQDQFFNKIAKNLKIVSRKRPSTGSGQAKGRKHEKELLKE
jgi:hypothetical protein